jgi:hypothetical protein
MPTLCVTGIHVSPPFPHYYSVRDYLQVLAMIAGTAILSMSKKVGACHALSKLSTMLLSKFLTIIFKYISSCDRNLLQLTHPPSESLSFF